MAARAATALAGMLLLGVAGRAQSPAPGQPGYAEWKASLIGAPQNFIIDPHIQPGGGELHEFRGGGSTCECWHEPDASYTTVNNGAQWNANGFNNPDDGSYGPILLPFQFYLYGQFWNSAYININGNVSFGTYYGQFSSTGFPIAGNTMVAPFWADVDLSATCGTCNQVRYKITPTALYVNWKNVGYFPSQFDKVNNFQLIITDGTDPAIPNGANVSFCYKDMQWTTGSASGGTGGFGGTAASVGANQGNGIDYIQFGRFDHPGTDYDGPYGVNDGVSFLDQQYFTFSTDVTTANVPPVVGGQSVCDSLVLCVGDPGTLDFVFISPEPGQTTVPSAYAPTMSDFTVTSSTSGQTATISVEVIPTLADTGYHVITFEATDDGTPVMTSTVSIVVHVLPSPILPPVPLSVCGNGEPVNMFDVLNDTIAPGGTWLGPGGGPHSGMFVPTSDPSGTYTYMVDAVGGCPMQAPVEVTSYAMQHDSLITHPLCHGDGQGSIQVISSGNGGPWNYVWADANENVVQSTLAANGDTFNGPGGTYTVVITEGVNGNGCVDSLDATIVEPDAVELLSVSDDTLICQAGTATLIAWAEGGTGSLIGHWNDAFTGWARSVTPLITTSYSVWATDSNNCHSDTLTVEVAVHDPIMLILPDTVITCPDVDTPLVIDSISGGDGAYQYNWEGQGYAPDVGFNINTTLSQQICLTVIDGCETPANTECLWLKVKGIPELELTVDTALGCDPFTVRFHVQDTTGAAVVDWNYGDGEYVPGPAGTVGHNYPDPGIYDVGVIVHWPNGCDDDTLINDMVTVEPVPDAQFVWSPNPATTLDPTVEFTEQAGPYATSWIWDFAGLDTAHGPEVSYQFPGVFGGIYPVQLVVSNYLGCTDTAVRNVEVMDEFLVFIPTAFTPNGDGINEMLFVQGDDIDTRDFDLMVFDRWGEVIYETTDRSKGWDGTFGGTPVQDGVYAWRLQARSFYSGRPHELLGHVVVSR